MAQSERMVNISLKINVTKKWLSKMILIACIFMLLTPSNVYSHTWQRFSQYDPIVSSLSFNHPSNANNNNNNKQSSNSNNNNNNNNNINNNDGSKLQNTGSVKHFNYRHIALGSQSNGRQGSWKKWIPQASGSSSSGSILYSPSSISSPSSSSSSLSSSSLYPPYNSVYRSRQHNNNINNDLHDNNCSRFERNCHECRRHDCSFLQCDGPELPSTICLNVASPSFFTRPSIHKVLSQCHFIEQCPPSSQLSSKWMDSASDGDTQSLISGSVSGSLPAPSNLVLSLYPSSQSSAGNSDSYSQRNPFSTADEFDDSKATKPNNNLDSALPYYYNASSYSSLSLPSSSSSSSSLLSSPSASDPKDLSYLLTRSGDSGNEFGAKGATSRSHSSFEKRQKNQQIQNRKRVAMHRYSQPWRHNAGTGDAILASALVADDSGRRSRITNTNVNSQHSSPSSSSSFSASSTGGVHIGIGTIIALMLCSSLVITAVLTVAYKKITKIYRNNHSRSYGVLEEE